VNEIPPGIPEAPVWSLALGWLGKGSIAASILFFVLAAVLYGFQPKFPKAGRVARVSFTLGCLGVLSTFGCLVTLFLNNQFQYQYVWEHGDVTTDIKYKISGVWNAQEGSFLLWAITSSIFGLLSVRGTGPYRRWFTVVYSVYLGVLTSILAYDTPFNLIPQAFAHGKWYVIPNGAGMTPSLQNYWDVIHPPTIFSGFGSLTIFFAYAMSALMTGDAKGWVSRARPWALVSTAILGLGICMGGLWAYDTQGWGGFWAWDPVENVSFVPWLFLVVFVHGLLVQTTRGRWGLSNIFWGAMPFIAYVYGTFLTRSGLLDKVSVHSFANMNSSALAILRCFLFFVIGAFAVTYWVRRKVALASLPEPEPELNGVHRESFYRFGMMLISLTAVVVALGMSWPVIVALRNGQGSKVDEWLYHQVMVWFFLPIMLLMAVTPFVSWRAMGWKALGNRIFTVTCFSIGITGVLQMLLMNPTIGVHALSDATVAGPFHTHVSLVFWMLLLILTCVFVAVGNIWRAAEIIRRSPTGVGGFVAHLGMATLMAGLIISRGYEQKEQIFVRQGSPAHGLGYLIAYKDTTTNDLFDRNRKVEFDVTSPSGEHFIASPGDYQYGSDSDTKDNVMPHVQRSPSHDVYISMLAPQIQAWDKPISLEPGHGQTINDTTIEYLKPVQKGKPGQAGTTFGAQIRLTAIGDDEERHQYMATPSVELTSEGVRPTLPTLGPDYKVALLGMDPLDKTAQLMLFFSPPIYPIEIFYKPLTGLVWAGAILMTLGGLLSAWSRRRVEKKVVVPV
jgi:cytochrome c-type biogenesis protein CcmF